MNKYQIAKEVELEDFKNAMEIMDFKPDDYTQAEIEEMFEEFMDRLANDDVYNGIYNDTLYSVVDGRNN